MGALMKLLSIGGLGGLVLACGISGPTPSPACPSALIDRGGGWQEIGGPGAWLFYDPPYHAASRGARKLFVRVDGAFRGHRMTIAGRPAGGSKVDGFVQWERPIAVSDFGPDLQPRPNLGGAIFFAGLTLTEPGCWEIVIGSDDEQLGSAFIDVQRLPPDSPSAAP